MLSVQHLKDSLFRVFIIGEGDGVVVKTHYKGKIYLVKIEPTYEVYLPPTRKPPNTKKKGVVLDMHDCPVCGSVLLEDICLNKLCPSLGYNKEVDQVDSPRG